MRALVAHILLLFLAFSCTKSPKDSDSINVLVFELAKDSSVSIPITLSDSTMTLYNHTEEIQMVYSITDSGIRINLPVFESYFLFDTLHIGAKGFWYDPSRPNSYKVPVSLANMNSPYEAFKLPNQAEVWECNFSGYKGKLDLYRDSSSDKVYANIQTETGDYRFLHGTITAKQLSLQTFDGAHLFLFTAEYGDGVIENGSFLSGVHYRDQWNAKRNQEFKLLGTAELVSAKDEFSSFSAENSDGDTLHFNKSSFTGKLNIIQIMGTWCPNCMDESLLLQQFLQDYEQQGLKVYAFAYERYEDKTRSWNAIKKAKKDMSLDYPIFLAGRASKAEASEDFSFLEGVYSFPTSIFLEKNGKILSVHSGFNGPATGFAYKQQISDFQEIIEEQLGLNE